MSDTDDLVTTLTSTLKGADLRRSEALSGDKLRSALVVAVGEWVCDVVGVIEQALCGCEKELCGCLHMSRHCHHRHAHTFTDLVKHTNMHSHTRRWHDQEQSRLPAHSF